ncbi:hypothetical protein D3C84_334230 [compost metagenome]
MLVVDFAQLREVVAAGDLVGELVVNATEVEMRARYGAGEAAVLVVEGNVLEVGAVAVLGFLQASAGEGQALELFGTEHAAFEGLRQDAPVVGLEDRQFRNQAADLQFGGGDFHFAGQAEFRVLVSGTPVIVDRQQTGTGAVGAGIELDPEHAQRIDTKPHGAIGVARLEIEHEALGPLVTFGLLGAGSAAKVAVEVHVAGFQGRAAVFEEGSLADRRKAGNGGGTGQGGGTKAGEASRRRSLRLCRQHRETLHLLFLLGRKRIEAFFVHYSQKYGSRNCPWLDSNGRTFR